MKIKQLILDVDGVLTDGSLHYTSEGEVSKSFNVKDGMGIHMLQKMGIQVCILSNGQAKEAVEARMRKLNISIAHIGSGNKGEILSNWIEEFNWDPDNIWYMGDDVNDLEVIPYIAQFCCPMDAEWTVIQSADWVSERPGGKGAVRDLCNYIIEELEA